MVNITVKKINIFTVSMTLRYSLLEISNFATIKSMKAFEHLLNINSSKSVLRYFSLSVLKAYISIQPIEFKINKKLK